MNVARPRPATPDPGPLTFLHMQAGRVLVEEPVAAVVAVRSDVDLTQRGLRQVNPVLKCINNNNIIKFIFRHEVHS